MSAFEVLATDGAARRGRLATRHGVVETPVFMPCGTYGTVKGMTPRVLRETGTQMLLGNTLHLLLRPGDAALRELGGLHPPPCKPSNTRSTRCYAPARNQISMRQRASSFG